MSNEEIIRAFHLMWDNFPEAVTITQKSREIVAVNKKAAEFGLQPGIKCSTIGKPENHRGCQCDKAVDTGEAQFCTYEGNFGKAYGYWIPIPEKPEWVIHFGVGYAFEYPKIDRNQSVKPPESVYNLSRGTDLETAIATLAQGEANGVMMYYALARLANEQGLPEVAKTFVESANQEAVHAGFYATMSGKFPQDFWQFVAGVAKAEYSGKSKIKNIADAVRAKGFNSAADEIEVFAEQEWHHGVVIDELIAKYKPDVAKTEGKRWICSVCGYEHVGDNPPEKCPVCGQPASVFKEKIQSDSLHGVTKGTELDFIAKEAARAELNGTLMYYALARLATEQGLDDVAKILIESANQEAVHAGFYATLNGKYPKNFWELLDRVRAAEYAGEGSVKALADKFRAAGLNKAADEMEIFAAQEKHHGVVIDELFQKYKPDFKPADTAGQKIYVCPCCGYRYVGDLDSEPDNWTCPVCAQPKKDFKQIDAQVSESQPVQKVWVCTICGYEHKGDNPPDICPLCGQPATAFKEKTS